MAIFQSRRLWIWITVLVGVLVVSLPIAFVAWMFGLFAPLQSAMAERNTASLEQRLVRGESRARLEGQFGHGIAQPDHRREYIAETAREAGYGSPRVSEYSYVSGGGLCFVGYLGVAVYYDARDRVRGWKRITWGDGC
jgi:hypothetical protein